MVKKTKLTSNETHSTRRISALIRQSVQFPIKLVGQTVCPNLYSQVCHKISRFFSGMPVKLIFGDNFLSLFSGRGIPSLTRLTPCPRNSHQIPRHLMTLKARLFPLPLRRAFIYVFSICQKLTVESLQPAVLNLIANTVTRSKLSSLNQGNAALPGGTHYSVGKFIARA